MSGGAEEWIDGDELRALVLGRDELDAYVERGKNVRVALCEPVDAPVVPGEDRRRPDWLDDDDDDDNDDVDNDDVDSRYPTSLPTEVKGHPATAKARV